MIANSDAECSNIYAEAGLGLPLFADFLDASKHVATQYQWALPSTTTTFSLYPKH